MELCSDNTLDHRHDMESTALLETMIYLASDPVFIADPQGNLIEVNDPACQLLGYTREELVGKKLVDLMASDQVPCFVARPLQSEPWTYRHKNGSLIPTRVNAKMLPDGRWVAFVQDGRDRKQVDIILQTQAEKLQLALDFGRIGSWDWDLQTNQVAWDDVHFALLGLTPGTSTLEYNTWRECVHPDDIEDVETAIRTALATQTTYEAGYRVVHPDGSLHWLIGRGQALYDEAGQPVRMIGVLMDITERKLAEQLLQENEQRFTTLSQASPVAIFQMNTANECIYVNAQWSEMTGQPAAVASGMGWVETIHPDDRDRLAREWVQWVQTGRQQGLYQNEGRVMRPDGSIRWYYIQALPIMDADVVTGYIGTLTDITERKQAEQERERLLLQEQAARQEAEQLNQLKDELLITLQRFQDIFEFAEHGLAIGKGSRVERANPAFARMHGYTVEEMTGKPILELFLPEYQADYTRFFQQLQQVGHLTHESVHVRRDGSQFPVLLDVTVVKDSQGEVLYRIVTILDTTELKRLEGERQQAEAAVFHLNQRLRHLVQVIQQVASARDLETIMAAIRTTARQLVGADGSTFVMREGEFCYYADEEAIAPLYKGQRFPMETCISGWVMQHQTPAVIPDIFVDPRIPIELYQPTFIKSLAMIPIHTVAPIGAIGVYWASEYSPTPEEINLLQTLADAAAIAIQNLRLYAELEQRVQERTTQLQQSLAFEALLKRITDRVRDSLDEHQILQTGVTELAQGLSLECCDASIYNTERTTSTIICEFNRSPTPALGQTFALPGGAYDEIYQSLFCGEISQFCPLTPEAMRSSQHSLSILTCPIQDDQEVLGDLWLFKPLQAAFNEQEVRLIQQVANQCAIGLRQSRLYHTAQSQVEALEQLNHLKDEFLSTVSHELRSPMANIKMATKMLEVALGIAQVPSATPQELILSSPQAQKVKHYLEILNQECQRESYLINDLLDLARLDAGTTLLMPTEVYLQAWIPAVTQPFIERIQQQQQQLQIDISPDLPPLITDLPSLGRIITELVHNACKYTPPSEIIRITAAAYSSQTEINVANSGIEIPIEMRDRIFDKFYRIPHNDPWKHGGTGLGLALVKKLVELLQGNISVTSQQNCTQFTIALPMLAT